MNRSTIETLDDLAFRAAERASLFASTGDRTKAKRWQAVASDARRAADSLRVAMR